MRKKVIFSIIIVTLLISLILWLITFFQIDICLDNGGRWNYEERKCVFSFFNNGSIRVASERRMGEL